MVAGFLGRGNCGDEAMFQVIYETFAAEFDIVASVDQHGAYPGFWDWYPYDRCRIVHQIDTALLDRAGAPAGLIVGGGGLGFGFAGNQVIAARCFGVKLAFAGTDLPKTAHLRPVAGVAAAGMYLSLFDYVGVRTAAGVARARAIGSDVAYSADWALGLPADPAEGPAATNEIAVTLREYPAAMISTGYVSQVRCLLSELRARGWRPFLLPFAPEDERFLAEHGLADAAPVRRAWWNARRMKQMIGAAGGLISVGRLHPLIFAASARTRVVALEPPVPPSAGMPPTPKIADMCGELGIPLEASVDALLGRLDAGSFTPSDAERLAAGERRLGEMIELLKALFKGSGSAAEPLPAAAVDLARPC
jgi:polysaccharide pyruvyl transferase WcaK-like protein